MRGAPLTRARILRRLVAEPVRTIFVAYCALAIAGCATPVGVTRVDPRTAQYELTANALNADKPSSFSARQLLNLDLYELFGSARARDGIESRAVG